ncbi:hypothetical protein LguiA_008413 [Lonicera macranthoides]
MLARFTQSVGKSHFYNRNFDLSQRVQRVRENDLSRRVRKASAKVIFPGTFNASSKGFDKALITHNHTMIKSPFSSLHFQFLKIESEFELHRVLRSLRLRPNPDGSFCREEVVSCFAPHITTSLQLRRDLLLSETDSVLAFQEISDKLGSLNIPRPTIHSSIIEQIYLIAERLASESWKNCGRIRPILVEIGVALSNVNQDIDDELIITDVDDWFFVEEGVPVYKGASRSSIQELEKTTAGLSLKESSCSVCLEEFAVGSEVARLPCSHYYHTGCIVEWLEKSHLCPLCRFQMPVEPDWE